jgi:dTDP-4-amino-4,6-dideoxygalactose transaminase
MVIPKWPVADEREIELIRQVLESSQWGGFHEIVGRFEQAFAAFQDCQYGVSAFNGTVTLEMALEAMGIGPGDEVILPAISFVSTATAISRVGALPVFVDIEPYTFHIDPDRAGAAITPRTKALMAVHFGGPVANMDRLNSLGVPIVEDAAHSQGAEWRGRRAGSFGLVGSFSFQNGKVMTSGEGGILTTNDESLARKLRAIANTGRREGEGYFFHYTLGSNYRITALQAAVLTAQLERLPAQSARRAQYASVLRQQTADLPGLTWQQVPEEAQVHTNYLLLGRIDPSQFGATRDEFHRQITAAGIPCTPFYPHPLYGNPLYRTGGCRVEPCPVAEACIQDAFWFPHRLLLGSDADAQELATLVGRVARFQSQHYTLIKSIT